MTTEKYFILGRSKNGIVCEKPEQMGVIFGIGKSEDECLADALHWVGRSEIYSDDEEMFEEMLLAECTKDVYEYIAHHGGIISEGDLIKTDEGLADFLE